MYFVPKLIIVNQTLNELKVEKHPDKTFIGRIAKGFDFLGYSFEPKGLSIAPKTLANFISCGEIIPNCKVHQYFHGLFGVFVEQKTEEDVCPPRYFFV